MLQIVNQMTFKIEHLAWQINTVIQHKSTAKLPNKTLTNLNNNA
uniref:Uncharacterized protein n=1 Tax=Anguilla anguilla TaxID=7936 RepID=A0A0E9QKY3_ANGAN